MLCKFHGMEIITYPGLRLALVPHGDNVFYLLFRGGAGMVIDPPDSEIGRRILAEQHARLTAILITHHDWDHVGGVEGLSGPGIAIYQPADSDFDAAWEGLAIRGIHTPGHRQEHMAYYFPKPAPGLLFSGDCLFAGGCGRLFGLPPELMFASLRRLAELPDETHVYCGHDYLESNMQFAVGVAEPGNEAMRRRFEEARAARRAGRILLPSTIALEKATNPFMRARTVDEFARLRSLKDGWG